MRVRIKIGHAGLAAQTLKFAPEMFPLEGRQVLMGSINLALPRKVAKPFQASGPANQEPMKTASGLNLGSPLYDRK